MHGHNRVRPLDTGDGTQLQVQDIWYTIQGEGPFAGRPAIFIRLTGCNLRCHFCDTVWDDENDPQRLTYEVVAKIMKLRSQHNCNLLVITGGEPLRQNLTVLINSLNFHESYMQVQIETAGTYWQDVLLNDNVTIVCSPKTQHVHPKLAIFCNHWKYVIREGEVDTANGLPYATTQIQDPKTLPPSELQVIVRKYGSPFLPPERPGVTVWLSPCDEGDEAKTAANVRFVGELAMKYGYRAQMQLHKYMELP